MSVYFANSDFDGFGPLLAHAPFTPDPFGFGFFFASTMVDRVKQTRSRRVVSLILRPGDVNERTKLHFV